jgi:hypothetical protein
MQLHASRNVYILYIISTFLDSLLEGLQKFPTLKQIISLEMEIHSKWFYDQGLIIQKLRTQEPQLLLLIQAVFPNY